MHDFHVVEEDGRWTATRRFSQRGAGWFLGLFSLAWIGAVGWTMWTREVMGLPVAVLVLALLMGLLSGWGWLALVFGWQRLEVEGAAETPSPGRVAYTWFGELWKWRQELVLDEVVAVTLDAPVGRDGQPNRMLTMRVLDEAGRSVRFGGGIISERLEVLSQAMREELRRRGVEVDEPSDAEKPSPSLLRRFDRLVKNDGDSVDLEPAGKLARFGVAIHGWGTLIGLSGLAVTLGVVGWRWVSEGWAMGNGWWLAGGMGVWGLGLLPGVFVAVWAWSVLQAVVKWLWALGGGGR